MSGEDMEHVTPDGSRVDLLSDKYATEVDFSKKWAEAVGQSLFYAATTNRKPRIILLSGRNSITQDDKYYLRCLVVCRSVGIRLEEINMKRHWE